MAMTMQANTPSPSAEQPYGRWIPWVFVGLFGIVLAANATMITVAISTFTGMETVSAYKKGLSYNERLAAADRQEQLGWQASLATTAAKAGEVIMTFALQDRLETPITSANIRAVIERPLQDGFEQTVTFNEIGKGRYQATADLPLEGQWAIGIIAEARGEHFQLNERIQVMR